MKWGVKGAKFEMEEKKNMENLAYKPENYSYKDLLEMKDKQRYEIINGELYLLASPRVIHQEVVLEICTQLKDFFKDKKCKPFIAPLDVRLSGAKNDYEEYNVVQPDAFVVCDENKIDSKGILGAPDFIIEVTSPSSETYDYITKLNLYKKYKVKEYWIISLRVKIINCYFLNDKNEYEAISYNLTDEISSRLFEGLTINLKEVCQKNEKLLLEEENETYNIKTENR